MPAKKTLHHKRIGYINIFNVTIAMHHALWNQQSLWVLLQQFIKYITTLNMPFYVIRYTVTMVLEI